MFGQFLPTQIVRGATLTCSSTTTSATNSACSGAKLNGLDVRLGATEVNVICNAVTGQGFSSASGSGAVNPHAVWTGTAWTLDTTGTGFTPMRTIDCNR